jgi:hypothetical protein
LRRYIRQGRLAKQELAPQVVRIRPEDLDRFLERHVKISTGTGNCYVVKPAEEAPVSRLPRSRPPRYQGA